MTQLRDLLARDGFAIVDDCRAPIDELLAAVRSPDASGVRSHGRSVFAVRNLLAIRAVAEFARSDAVRALVEPVLGPSAVAVRGILFDKTPGANWKVPWHQDLSIAVKQRVEVDGFGPWSLKAGVTHVQPPVAVLDQMCTLRLHLDACGEDNGPLKVVPSSHRFGVLSVERLTAVVTTGPIVSCCVPQGGAVLMQPLLAHASSAATRPGHRRVIHIEFSGAALPPPLSWACAIGKSRSLVTAS
ncbi:phytanoyl-CoA dioxygenase family protein [soil metagenome]